MTDAPNSHLEGARRFRWMATLVAKKHCREKAKSPDRINHAALILRGREGTEVAGEPIVVGCVCGKVFWYDKKAVSPDALVGDWAKPFRRDHGVRARAPELKRRRRR